MVTAKEVQTIRARLGLSQRQLGKLIGLTSQTVNRWEHGNLKVKPAFETVLRGLERAPEKRVRSKEWLVALAAGAAVTAVLFLLMGSKKR